MIQEHFTLQTRDKGSQGVNEPRKVSDLIKLEKNFPQNFLEFIEVHSTFQPSSGDKPLIGGCDSDEGWGEENSVIEIEKPSRGGLSIAINTIIGSILSWAVRNLFISSAGFHYRLLIRSD
jgi:hypothetical protein